MISQFMQQYTAHCYMGYLLGFQHILQPGLPFTLSFAVEEVFSAVNLISPTSSGETDLNSKTQVLPRIRKICPNPVGLYEYERRQITIGYQFLRDIPSCLILMLSPALSLVLPLYHWQSTSSCETSQTNAALSFSITSTSSSFLTILISLAAEKKKLKIFLHA